MEKFLFTALPTFIVVLREVLEIVVLAVPLYVYLKKSNFAQEVRLMWFATITGIITSILIAVTLPAIASGNPLFEAIVMFGAALLVAGAFSSFLSVANPLNTAVDISKTSIFLFTFLTVLREGVEIAACMLSLQNFGSTIGQWIGLLAGTLIGAIGSVALNLYAKANLRWFFNTTKWLIIAIGCYLTHHGFYELQAIGLPISNQMKVVGTLFYFFIALTIFWRKWVKRSSPGAEFRKQLIYTWDFFSNKITRSWAWFQTIDS